MNSLRGDIKKYSDSKKHNYQCTAHGEGQDCCLDKPEILAELFALILNKLPEKNKRQLETTDDDITWCLTCEQILNNDGDCWCKPVNQALDEFRSILEGK